MVSVDGGCVAVKDAVRPGDIDATAQQFPQYMALKGVCAIADPTPGVSSHDVAFGVRNCWGD